MSVRYLNKSITYSPILYPNYYPSIYIQKIKMIVKSIAVSRLPNS